MNPMSLLKLRPLLQQFRANHPKFPLFFKAAANAAGEGSVLEISLVTAEGKKLITNMKMDSNDVELMREIRKMFTENKNAASE